MRSRGYAPIPDRRPDSMQPQAKTNPGIDKQVYRPGSSKHHLADITIYAHGENVEAFPRPSLSSGGRALPDGLREKMGRSLGHNFSGVRIHEDPSAESMGAMAYTRGEHIHFAPGQYRPESSDGQRLLGHELAHVKQQANGRVSRPNGRPVNDNMNLEAEADTLGARASSGAASMGTASPPLRSTISSPPVSSAPIQMNGTKRTRSSYEEGTHGAKKREQKRLKGIFGVPVTGSTHESEHTIGFEPLNQTSGEKRGKGRRARSLENSAPAYQESKPFHRRHIGTGSRSTEDESGFNAQSYRHAQRSLMEQGDISSAVQLNQLGYAFNPDFQDPNPSTDVEMATDSFKTMVRNMQSFTYAQGAQDVSVPINERQRREMELSRQTALTGKWPTLEEIAKANQAMMEED